ncbi:MAG: aldolase/citrate lyase family protein [Kiritimatiellae bacterium]|nr:aldolase/citrate lyase family protein [Kiritimatiellia bacterium]
MSKDPRMRIGTFLSLSSPVVAEVCGKYPFDWIMIDGEHGAGASEDALFHILQAMGQTRAKKIVRLGEPDHAQIQHALDWGADGLMIPHVDSPAVAQKALDSMLYPPKGRRGYSRSVRAFGYGTTLPEVPPKPLLFAQIETLEAVERAGEIAAVDGVDVLFVGPADLGFDLKARGVKTTVEELLPKIAGAVLPTGKGLGILTRDDADVAKRLSMGYVYQAVDSDLGILRRRWKELTD